MIREAYVRTLRAARGAAERTRVLDRLGSSDRASARHLRTLFAIHDLDDMISLDLPWWTYRAAGRVEDFLADREGKARVFEYGSGASTLWLAKRAGEVHSVEHHAGFAEFLAGRVAGCSNVTLRHVPARPVPARPAGAHPVAPSRRLGHRKLDFADYVRAIDEVDGEFDLMVIDGRARIECLRAALPRLAADGMIVFDNYDRRRYRQDIRRGRLLDGLAVERLRGAAPCLPYLSVTALITPVTPAG
jgi:predicted O-methyltransferase YrrM